MTPEPPDPITALGHVASPPPEVLHAARETLWSAIAQEILTTTPSPTSSPAANSQGVDGTLYPLEGTQWHIDP